MRPSPARKARRALPVRTFRRATAVPGAIEHRVLAGAREAIARYRPRIAVYRSDINARAVAEIAGYRELARRNRARQLLHARGPIVRPPRPWR